MTTLQSPWGFENSQLGLTLCLGARKAIIAVGSELGLPTGLVAGNFAPRTRELHSPRGEAVRLTKVEHALLVAFLDKPQIPLAREHLLQSTRIHEDIFDRSIDVQILRLRKKLELDASSPRMILTQRGRGYVFALPVERD